MAKKSQSFEQSITRLDEIVRQLEQGNVPLEDALKLFQEGTGSGRHLRQAPRQSRA